MRVADVLRNKVSGVPTIRMHETVEVAARILHQWDVGALVVKDECGTEGDVALGILSERDITRAVAANGRGVLKKPVSVILSGRLVSCSPEDSLQDVRDLLERHHIFHLPVLDGHTLIGVLALSDLLLLAGAPQTPQAGLAAQTAPSAR